MTNRQQKNAFVEHFLKQNLPDLKEKKFETLIKSLHNKPILTRCESSLKSKKNKNSTKESKVQKLLPGRKLQNHSYKYSEYEPLRQLWREYINGLLVSNKERTVDLRSTQDILLKADYHGANITVVKSKCKTYENLTGTVIMETKNMFFVVTKRDRVAKIPKMNSIFEVDYPGLRIALFGDQFCIKPAHRLTKKFKNYVPQLALV